MIEPIDLAEKGVFTFENYGDAFYESDILIGNGFSINLCPRLNYRALYELFAKECSEHLQEIFTALNTSNFELVIDTLKKAHLVTSVLGSQIEEIDKLVLELQNGLIDSIQKTHPTYQETNLALLRSLATELSVFKNIYTTNYDVFLYKIILQNNDLCKLKLLDSEEFQDAFYEEISDTQLAFGTIDNNKRQIYYLHGSLFLFSPRGFTYKLRKIDAAVEFIKLIRREVENDNFPLFVAEGSALDKRNTINNNYYLRTCLEALKRTKSENLTTYGFSFSSQDQHIVEMINASGIKKILISIYPNYDTLENLEIELSRLRNMFGVINVNFFDARTLFSFHEIKHAY